MTTVTPKTFTGTDALGSYADVIKLFETQKTDQTDALGSYADNLAILKADIPINISLSADPLGSYADSIAPLFTLGQSAGTDGLGSYADLLQDITGLLVSLTESNDLTISGLAGYWKLDGNALDISGNGNNGTITGAVFVPGVIGQALSFSSSTDIVDCGTSDTLLPAGSPVSISLWIYLNTASPLGNQRYLVHRGIFAGAGGGLYIGPGNGIGMDFDASGVPTERDTVDNVITPFTWTHVVMTWDGGVSGSGVHFYINGIEPSYTNVFGSGTVSSNSGATFHIGGFPSLPNDHFPGFIDEVRDYDHVLSQSEITALYNYYGNFSDYGADFANLNYFVSKTDSLDNWADVANFILTTPTILALLVSLSDELGFGAANQTFQADAFQSDAFQLGSATTHDSVDFFLSTVSAIAVALSDDLNNWNDNLAAILDFLVALSDALGSYSDAPAALVQHLVSQSDALGGYADQLNALFSYLVELNDALGSYADSPAALIGLLAALQSNLNFYNDSLSLFMDLLVTFTDDLNNWFDAVFANTEGIIPLFVMLTDNLNNWNDTIKGFFTYAATETDDLGKYSDTFTALYGYLLRLSDDLQNLSDSASLNVGLQADLTDLMGYADSLEGFLEYFAKLGPDDFNAWLDHLRVVEGTIGPSALRPMKTIRWFRNQ